MPPLLTLFQALLRRHFESTPPNPEVTSHRTDVLNLFVMSLVWTFGALLPAENRKSFSRQFKYLIKRAIQANLEGIDQQSLPYEEEDLFQICYFRDRWVSWKAVQSEVPLTNRFNLTTRVAEDDGLFFTCERLLENNYPVFLVGGPANHTPECLSSLLSFLSGEV